MMEFTYKGKIYDTSKSSGKKSTNRLQVTKDKNLQLAVVHEWFGSYTHRNLKNNELEVLFDLALTSARYQDIIEEISGLTKVGTYPDWVIDEVNRRNDRMTAGMLKDMLEESDDDHAFVEKVREFINDTIDDILLMAR